MHLTFCENDCTFAEHELCRNWFAFRYGYYDLTLLADICSRDRCDNVRLAGLECCHLSIGNYCNVIVFRTPYDGSFVKCCRRITCDSKVCSSAHIE